MAHLRGLWLDLCVGMLAGTGLADVCAPTFYTWYHIPGGGDAMCHCAELVQATTQAMVKTHLVVALACGLLFAVLGQLLRRRGGRGTGTGTGGGAPTMPA